MQLTGQVKICQAEKSRLQKHRYWQSGELITIGTFAALIKLSTMVIAIAGGGMNPVSMVLKNIASTSLLIILVYKVRKFGVLAMFSVISGLVSLLLMGGNAMLLVGSIGAGLVFLVSGYRKTWTMVLGVGLYDLLARAISLGYSWFFFQEQIKLFVMGMFVVGIGYAGCLIGLATGVLFARELRHAGIIRQ
jgi:energy-coupling factor transport system substrate-specific component